MECPRLATVEMCCLFAYTTDGCGHERRGVGGGWVGVGGGGGEQGQKAWGPRRGRGRVGIAERYQRRSPNLPCTRPRSS